MKKNMLFMLINMNIGGTEKALLNMINELPLDKYNMTIFMLEEYGGFLNSIPPEVKVEYFSGYKDIKDLLNKPPKLIFFNLLKKWKLIQAFIIIFLHILTRILQNRSLYFKYILRNYPLLEKEYDVAVAYDGPMDFISYFVLKKIRAKKKFQWIHFDITKIGFNPRFAEKIYSQFDKIFVVSNEAEKKLTEKVPTLKNKTNVFFNISSPELIKSHAKKGTGFTDKFNGIRILTVGRLSIEKGQDLAIYAFSRLLKDGYDAKWYCIGDGNAREHYEKLIKKYNLQNRFILLGATPNPYPFIDQCDIYVQPSKHEGFCITLAEARCLRKPIVSTEFSAAREQIRNRENGLIVGIDEKELYNGIVELINNKDMRKQFTENLKNENPIDNQEINLFLNCAI
ncbi:glycosyltransferase [Bacillus sp. USDA818B3_A]|uniref:glycosyltransferase n=1 Tax=Bacillus sp. USDA818B3_A TaxID=2698834 RepID=UPI00136B15D4|nr:glycosyltransferase [Bacillus sp. USDA818B3_A]